MSSNENTSTAPASRPDGILKIIRSAQADIGLNFLFNNWFLSLEYDEGTDAIQPFDIKDPSLWGAQWLLNNPVDWEDYEVAWFPGDEHTGAKEGFLDAMRAQAMAYERWVAGQGFGEEGSVEKERDFCVESICMLHDWMERSESFHNDGKPRLEENAKEVPKDRVLGGCGLCGKKLHHADDGHRPVVIRCHEDEKDCCVFGASCFEKFLSADYDRYVKYSAVFADLEIKVLPVLESIYAKTKTGELTREQAEAEGHSTRAALYKEAGLEPDALPPHQTTKKCPTCNNRFNKWRKLITHPGT
ncbi:hypothetical protein BDV96DRAFT_654235 [Lophiotrema nucula]|uniref:Uncharacterized protein n=1 Tax=Lophiotrema nucula TaxID=690887 RepID=A0A6A5YI30_9PLEO|nr:hypothetical protein BDV96DRAFT_654235 [Lophiotrema nucula]